MIIRRMRVLEIEVTEKRTCDANGVRPPGKGHPHERVVDKGIDSTIFEESPCISCSLDIGFSIQRNLDVCVTIEVLHQTLDAYDVSRWHTSDHINTAGGTTRDKGIKNAHPIKHSAQHARRASTGCPSAFAVFRIESRIRRRISSSVTMRDPKAMEPKDLKARPSEWSVGLLGCR